MKCQFQPHLKRKHIVNVRSNEQILVFLRDYYRIKFDKLDDLAKKKKFVLHDTDTNMIYREIIDEFLFSV